MTRGHLEVAIARVQAQLRARDGLPPDALPLTHAIDVFQELERMNVGSSPSEIRRWAHRYSILLKDRA